jgi:allophanate hydrolase
MKYFPDRLTIAWLQKSYAAGELTPAELLKEILWRAETHREKNVWITPPAAEFIQKYIDRLPTYDPALPLWGVPFSIKDNIDLAGVATTAACPAYAYTPKKNAPVVQKLILAGAIPVGKTNMDQFATGLTGTRSPYGKAHNAYQPELISGGSSSGSAASVALGLAAFALGTDTAGSGRVPAALHSLIGYKPPVGAWSTRGVVPACASIDCVTVFACNLADAVLVDKTVRGTNVIPRPPEKILLPEREPEFFGDYAEIYRTKWLQTVRRIEQLGIPVEFIDITVFEKAAKILYEGAYIAERWAALGEFIETHPGALLPVTESILRTGNDPQKTAAALFRDIHALQEYRAEVRRILADQVLILPTVGGTFTQEQVRQDPIGTNNRMGYYTNHCNLLDLCAVAVPENEADRTLPFGLTIFALTANEALLFKTAELFFDNAKCKIAVCGLHKKGYPLEYQLRELGADYSGRVRTAAKYRLYALDTDPPKPGLVRCNGGASVEVDIFELSWSKLGAFMQNVKAPLSIGNIELSDGSIVKGFLCEPYALEKAAEITETGF